MDTYLTEIKQLRIPRPKFEPNSSPPNASAAAAAGHHHWRHFVRPYTPPRDYHLPGTPSELVTVNATRPPHAFQSGCGTASAAACSAAAAAAASTEELRTS